MSWHAQAHGVHNGLPASPIQGQAWLRAPSRGGSTALRAGRDT